MKYVALALYRTLVAAGVDPVRCGRFIRGLPRFVRDWRRLSRDQQAVGEAFRFGLIYPCLDDLGQPGGTVRGHYFNQDLLVAQRIFRARPRRHIDVGSRVDGFVAHVAAFREIEVCDVRPITASVSNITFRQIDLTATLPPLLHQCCDSLSCLHALEHIGLGRYGDQVDGAGHRKALANLALMLEPGGRLYLSVPIGPQRIEFNAHRVFSVAYLLAITAPAFVLERLSYIDDAGVLRETVPLDAKGIGNNFGCSYGCGILELIRASVGTCTL